MLINIVKWFYFLVGIFKLGFGKSGKFLCICFNEVKIILRDFIGIEFDDDKDFIRSEEVVFGRFFVSEEFYVSFLIDVFFIIYFLKYLRFCNIYFFDE